MATPKPALAAGAPVNFGESNMYAGGFNIAEGNYYVKSLNVVMHNGFKPSPGKGPWLGVMAEYIPLNDFKEENLVKAFYSMGGKADQSFAPNPETGKGLVVIPGAQGATLQENTNWDVFRKSWLHSGLPAGIFTNDLSVLEGAWVHLTNQDPPEERKNYQKSATAEVTQEEPRKDNKITVIAEILEGGAPWEGGGGVPKGKVTPIAKAAPLAPKPAAPQVAQASEVDADGVRAAAADCVTDVLTANPNGMPRLKLGTDTFKVVSKKYNEQMAAEVAEAYFKGPNAATNLGNLVGELGYQIAGASVKPA